MQLPPLSIGTDLININLKHLVEDLQTILNHFENENYVILIEKGPTKDYKFHLLFKEKVDLNSMVKGILHAHIGREIVQGVRLFFICMYVCMYV